MATMVDWLDEALDGAREQITDVLVLQVIGAAVNPDARKRRFGKERGWFYQILAPLTTLFAVRTAGQIAHNDVELELLKEKWRKQSVAVDSVTFEFPNADAPLSWHLTPTEIAGIGKAWAESPRMLEAREKVKRFLAGATRGAGGKR